MLSIGPHTRIYLFAGITDMRKGFDGLRAIVEQSSPATLPQSGHLFGFANRRRNMVRFLYWDGTGFWICAKRLQRGTFWWPAAGPGGHTLAVSPEKLAALLGGLEPPVRERRGWLRVQPVAA
jgi:transposase